MYSFRFLRTVHAQRKALLAATEYADVAMHPILERTLDSLGEIEATPRQQLNRRSIWLESLRAVKPLLIRSAAWQCVSAAGLVVSLLIARNILAEHASLMVVVLLCLAYLAAELTKNLVFFFDLQRRAQVARGIQLHLFNIVNQKLLVLDAQTTPEFSTGNVKTLLSGDVEAIEDFITTALSSWVPSFCILLATVGPILSLSGVMGGIGIIIALLQVPIAFVIALWIERYKDVRQAEQDKLTTVIGEWVRNVRLVRYLNWDGATERQIRAALRRFSVAAGKAHLLVCIAWGISFSWWMIPILGMLAYGTFANIPLSAIDFFPSIWLLSLLSNQIQFLPHSLTQYGEASAAVARLGRFLKLPEIKRHLREDRIASETALGEPIRIHLSGVSVSYPTGDAVCDLSLSLDLSAHTAVVGEVGSGKSTLLKLLLGELAPSKGEIDIEFSSGVRAPLWGFQVYPHYRRFIAYAPQEPFLSNARLRDNLDLSIRRGLDEVTSAAAQACLLPDIQQFEHGLDEEVGETGINLSGGQKQRVSLARAFISKRPFLLLDDPLSAVDTATERVLFKSFISESSGFVLVSHRVSELNVCDRILVLDAGRVVEDGAPQDLLARKGARYSAFLEARLREDRNGE